MSQVLAAGASRTDLVLFALGTASRLGSGIARQLNVPLADHEERSFEDGEHKARPLVSVRDRDVYVVDSLFGEPGASVNDKLCRLLFFLSTLADASAARVTAIVPYLCYSRKDRRTKARDPVTSRYVAALFEASAVDRVVTMDVHNPAAFQNAFRIPTEHIEAKALFASALVRYGRDDRVVVVSPDPGGHKRADRTRHALEALLGRSCELAFVEKTRSEGVLAGEKVVGQVAGARALIVDDLVSSGRTLVRAARVLREAGASGVVCAATHGVFGSGASEALADAAIDRVLVTNTVDVERRVAPGLLASKVEVLDATPLLAETIRRMHGGGSLCELTA